EARERADPRKGYSRQGEVFQPRHFAGPLGVGDLLWAVEIERAQSRKLGQLGDGLQAANSVQYKPRETCDATEPLERLEWHLEERQPPQRPQPVDTCERLERRLRNLQLSQVAQGGQWRQIPKAAVDHVQPSKRTGLR